MNQSIVFNLTPTGIVPTKTMTPHVPITTEEIVEQVGEAINQIGVTVLHLHARDKEGKPTSDMEIYGKIIETIRKQYPDLVICVSLSGRQVNEFERRSAPLMLTGNAKPDMGSLTTSSLNFVSQASLNAPDTVQRLAQRMKEFGIVPEIEVFDLGMINYTKYLIRKQLLEPPFYCNIILGNIAGAQPDLTQFGAMIGALPSDCYWSAGGIGEFQLRTNVIAISCGGGVRVGLEDNIYFDSAKTRLASNLDLLKRLKRIADEFERPIMSPVQFRQLMQIPRRSQ